MKKRGRKEKYATHIQPYLDDITKWIGQGEPEYLIYGKLGVSHDTWIKYKIEKLELIESLKKGEQNLTKHIESMLYKRCTGFEYDETKTSIEKIDGKEKKKVEKITKKVLPSDTAIIFALKNLDPDKWKDRQDIKQNINQRIENIIIDIEDDED